MKQLFTTPFSRKIKTLFAVLLFSLQVIPSFAGPKIDIHIEFGRRSMDCNRFSICHWSHEYTDRLNASIENTGKFLQFNIKNEAFVGHDGMIQNGYFIMEEECAISDADKKALMLPGWAILKPGKYRVTKTDTGYIVNIPFQ